MALTDKLTAIGDAIRAQNGTTEAMTLDEMATAITNLSSGGSGGMRVVESKSVSLNGATTGKILYVNMNEFNGGDETMPFVICAYHQFSTSGSTSTTVIYYDGSTFTKLAGSSNYSSAAFVNGTLQITFTGNIYWSYMGTSYKKYDLYY